MLDKDFSDLTPAVIPESQDFENLQEIRKFVGEKLPDPNRLENISDLDDLMLAQLRENVERCDAAHYLNTQGDYELPCEFKRVDEEFYFFIPRVTDWQYIRATPFDANHSPFLETYSGKDHDFAKAFERIMGIIPYHFIGGHPSTKIGLEGEKDMTRYHHIKLTQDGLEITLLSTPNVYQVEKLQSLQARLREKGIKIDIKYEIRDHGVALPQAQEHALMVEIPNTPINLSVNYESTKPHEFDVDESGRVIVISNSLPNNSEYIYGYGYQNSQMYYGTYDRQGINSLSFYFEPTARNHGQAMSGLMLDKVCEQRNQNSVRTLQETRKDLEGSLVEETEVLEDKWTYRYDILKKILPYTIYVQGYCLACGFRSALNKETGELTVELLVERSAIENTALKSVFERMNMRVAKELESKFQVEQKSIVERGILRSGLEIRSISKLIPVIKN